MKRNTINKDYTYCSGVTCPVRKDCKRYLPNPPDIPLSWISPSYIQRLSKCPNFSFQKRE